MSIIIPSYNCDLTLKKCLDSIVKQTFIDYEVLILDNKSKDNTLSIARSFKDNRIKIFSETDSGIYDAMNKGIHLAEGDWLYFLGSDDSFYEETTLEKIFEWKDFKKYDVVYGNVSSPRFNGVYAGKFTYLRLENQNICHQAIFFNRKVFRIIGIFQLKYKVHADWDHNIKWFYHSKIKHVYLNIIIANYADGGFSSTQADDTFNSDKFKIIFKSGKKIFTLSKLISLSTKIIEIYKEQNKNYHRFYYQLVRFYLRKLRTIKKKEN
ncbi:glycosyltransferase family 2 protein [uncultured Polaribacter sp.]|uniref:glycosyltransferase family 2 protein n=1 Tax=uncultured Polaribacter sp. TaxID=174711 RepID=UPI00260FB388|nr:glycosyltransferase family 2 protein [uncultured Polaribacter sp.]